MSYQTATSLLLVTALYLTLSSATNESEPINCSTIINVTNTHMYLILSSCSNVQEKLNGLKEAVEALCEGTSVSIPTVQNTWTSVPITSIAYDTLILYLSSSQVSSHQLQRMYSSILQCIAELLTVSSPSTSKYLLRKGVTSVSKSTSTC